MSNDDGHIGDADDDEAGATILVAQNKNRRTSFVVDSGAQAHNRQDLEVFYSSARAAARPGSPSVRRPGSSDRPTPLSADGGNTRHYGDHAGPFEVTTEDGQYIVIQDVANAPTFKKNVLSISPCLRKGGTTVKLYERCQLYYADLYRSATRAVVSIYTTGGVGGAPRPYDEEDNESYEEHDLWPDGGDSRCCIS